MDCPAEGSSKYATLLRAGISYCSGALVTATVLGAHSERSTHSWSALTLHHAIVTSVNAQKRPNAHTQTYTGKR